MVTAETDRVLMRLQIGTACRLRLMTSLGMGGVTPPAPYTSSWFAASLSTVFFLVKGMFL